MVQVIKSDSSNVAVLLPSMPKVYFTHGKIGAILTERVNSDDPMDVVRKDAIGAHQGSLVFVRPPEQKTLTFKPHYSCEPFAECWFIPIRSERQRMDGKGMEKGKITPLVLSTFLMRSRSKDEFAQLLEPVEAAAWERFVEDPSVAESYDSTEAYLQAQCWSALETQVFDFEFISDVSNGNSYAYLKWSLRDSQDPIEAEVLKLAQRIRTGYTQFMLNEVVEKAAQLARVEAGLESMLPEAPAAPNNGRRKAAKS